jgi:DUF971 family protein
MGTQAFPESIALTDEDSVLEIDWDDGHKGRHRLDVVRSLCPCAQCQGHHPSQSLNLKPAQFEGIRLTEIAPVGRYAYNLVFSDGHNTGIYTLEFLRELKNTA